MSGEPAADLYTGKQWTRDELRREARDLFTTLVEVRDALAEVAERGDLAQLGAVLTLLKRRTHGGSQDVAEALVSVERAELEALVATTCLSVGDWAARHRAELAEIPAAWRDTLTVRAVVGYLLGQRLVRPCLVQGPPCRPLGFDAAVPKHLRPDLVEAVNRSRRIQPGVVGSG